MTHTAYRYIAADLAYPATPVAELPLTGVTWGRMLNGAAEFSGKVKLPPVTRSRRQIVTQIVVAGVTYLRLTGVAPSSASTPDTASLDIAGDIDIRWFGIAEDWTPAVNDALVAKWSDALVNQRAYLLRLDTAGRLVLFTSPDGTASQSATSTVSLTAPASGPFGVRATRDVNDGAGNRVTNFYTSTDNGANWTPLGATVTQAGTTSIFNSDAPLEVGTRSLGVNDAFAGNVTRVEVRDGIGGTIVANPDFTAQTAGTTLFTDGTGKTWTINAPASLEWSTVPSTTPEVTYELSDNSEAVLIARLYKEATDRATKCVYVVRDGTPLGCYIIWDQTYSSDDQSISVKGAELFSYARRRIVEHPSGVLTAIVEDTTGRRPVDIAATLMANGNGANLVLDVLPGGGTTIDKTYRGTDNRGLADEIVELAALEDGGFDFRTDVRLSSAGGFERVWIAREFLGGSTEIVAKYETNVAGLGVSRRGDLRANDVIVFGPTQSGDSSTRTHKRVFTNEWAPPMVLVEAHSDKEESDGAQAARAVALFNAHRNHELYQVSIVASAIDATLGTFHPGDVMRLVVSPHVDPWFCDGLDVSARLLAYSVKVPDEGAGTEVVTLTLAEP